jgi:hypothetical protein
MPTILMATERLKLISLHRYMYMICVCIREGKRERRGREREGKRKEEGGRERGAHTEKYHRETECFCMY